MFAESELTSKSSETQGVSSAVKGINTLITVIERIQFNLALHCNGEKSNHDEITQIKRKQFSRIFKCT